MDPTEYAKQMRRHRYAIVSIAVALIIAALIIVFRCQILGYFGLPGCCCQGARVDAVTLKSPLVASSFIANVIVPSKATWVPGGAPNGGHPFGVSPRLMGDAISPTSWNILTGQFTAPSAFQIAPAIATTDAEPVDITGELGDGGDEYVNVGPAITGIEPPDECDDAICWVIGKHHHKKPPPCITDCGTVSPPPISAAPEPAQWLLLVFGFGLVGVTMRGRPVPGLTH